jgi:hypothetical protein
MSKQAPNRLYVSAFIDKKARKAVAEVVEPKSLAGFQLDSILIAAGRIFSFPIMLALSGVLPFIFVEGKTQSSGLA